VPGRLNPESPGLKRVVEIAQECKPVDLIALRGFGLEDAWLEPGERFQCEQRVEADLVKAGVAEQMFLSHLRRALGRRGTLVIVGGEGGGRWFGKHGSFG
jgi:hypothetical protein